MTGCSIDDCEKRVHHRGLCSMHAMRLRRTGSTDLAPKVLRVCVVDGCSEPYHANGYCAVHAARLRRNGDPLAVRRPDPLTSFWSRVDKESGSDCWFWTGPVQANGYGQITTRKRPTPSGTRLAHRVCYELEVGPIGEGLHLDHLCRNILCVNPAHLDPVSPAENTRRGLHGVLRTHCDYGHALTPENTMYDAVNNSRRCRTCAKRWNRDAKARLAARTAVGA